MNANNKRQRVGKRIVMRSHENGKQIIFCKKGSEICE